MTDRELLELAAKAAGYILGAHSIHAHKVCLGGVEWNPLTDDGDALRLASDLSINTYWMESGRVHCFHADTNGPPCIESGREDRLANYRRAITRAAVDIGRAL